MQPEIPPPDELTTWIASQPKWLQTAAAKLFQNQPQGSAFYEEMADLCHGEASKTQGLLFETLPLNAFSLPRASFNMRLDKISGINGLNAIRPGVELSFVGSNLTIIFGTNGAGKSGFARLLKHACGARHKSNLLSNIFDTNSPVPSAHFTVTRDGKQETFEWKAGDHALKELRYLHVFDTVTANEYVSAKNEASYETRRLRFISSLIRICDDVTDVLTGRINNMICKLPSLPVELSQSQIAAFLDSLSHKTSKANIDQASSFTDQDLVVRTTLETTLTETNIEGRLQNVRNYRQQLAAIELMLNKLKNGYSSEKFDTLVQAQIDSNIKRQAANDAAQFVFSNTPLEGVGAESWRELWKYARLYSEQVAYKGIAFPVVNNGAYCILCQQPLSEEACMRFHNFEEFVKGSLEADAQKAAQLYNKLKGEFPEIPNQPDWERLLIPLKLDTSIVEANFVEMGVVQNQLNIELPDPLRKPLIWLGIEEALAEAKASGAQQEQVLLDSQDPNKRIELQNQLLELKGREWIAQQKTAIEAEIVRQGAIVIMQAAIKLAKTNALTAKKTVLMTSELSQGYQDRFAEELQYLGGNRIPVEPKAISQGKGKVSFQVKLKGATREENAHHILSEGEHRIVALAAFLADMRGLGFPSPFIFDDPISSLDQDYEERVVARLVELAKDRQLIIFTHRLSLVTLLQEIMSNGDSHPPQIETLLRVGKHIGVPDTLKIRHQKPQQGFSEMQKSLGRLRVLEENGDILRLETSLNVACTDFRIQLEKAIETCLLNEIVLRFRRSLQTKDRLHKLRVIAVDDINFLENMMTKYSVYEHSQSDELPAQPIPLEELTRDIQAMIDWMANFKKKKPS